LVIGRKKKNRKTGNEVRKEAKRVMKYENLKPEDAVNRQIWRTATENQ
jgi:ribosomal protein L31E